jgi:excisionase family DNA binding protein
MPFAKGVGLRSLPQAAEELGVTVACLRAWIYRRQISYIKVGRVIRIRPETIEAIVERGTVPALDREIAQRGSVPARVAW